MILYKKYLFAILGVAVLCTAISSPALTLGRARGLVLVGQSLKLTVPVRGEPGEGASALCFEADVFYGDTQQDPSRVSVNSDFSPASLSGNVQVSSDARVDEPVVTVYLRSGCQHKTSRRYVLLADLTGEVASPAKESREQSREVTQVRMPAMPLASAEPDAGSARVKSARLAIPVMKPVAPRRAHLKLAPLDLTIDRDPMLKLSNDLYVGDMEDLQRRAEAVALWRTLNANPQDILSTDSRRQTMEADLKGLQAITVKNHQTLQELTARLNKAQSDRYFNPLVYGLFVVLAACCAAMAYAWFFLRQAGQSVPWWRHDGEVAGLQVVRDDASEVGLAQSSLPVQFVEVSQSPQPIHDIANTAVQHVDAGIDIQLGESTQKRANTVAVRATNPSAPLASVTAASRAVGHVDFAHSVSASLRALNSQEMLDVRQQAEFFMTLGQHEDAIGLLEESLDRSADSNPLVYLDLLKVLHTLGRKVEYDQYRADFNALFSGCVPPYAEFNQTQDGLEAYSDVCQKIGRLWPSEEVVDYIETCMVRTHVPDAPHEFELEAFRDLLMLHGIAQRLVFDSDTGFQPFSAVRDGARDAQPTVPVQSFAESISVDLDLSEAPAGNLIDFDEADLVPFKPPGHKPK